MMKPSTFNTELEASVLGLVLFDPLLASTVALEVDDFESETHQRFWEVGRTMARQGKVITVGAVTALEPKLGAYLSSVAGFACRREDLEAKIATLKDISARRRLRQIAQAITADIENLEMPVEEITAGFIRDLSKTVAARTAKTKREVAEMIVNGLDKPAPCYSTGLPRLDYVLGGGLFAGKLYGIAARKKLGKTALAGTISHNMNKLGTKHLFIALEMSDVEIEQRNMSRDMDFNSVKFLRRDDINLANRVADYATQIPNNTLYEHVPGASLDEIRRMVSRAIVHHGIKGAILDYWQLTQGKAAKETEEYHLRNVAQYFADICRKENIWAIVNAQVNTEGNTRGGEGLKLASDVYFTLHREKDDPRAWLEMEESRYVLYNDVGSETEPGLLLNKHGPFFEDPTAPPENTASILDSRFI